MGEESKDGREEDEQIRSNGEVEVNAGESNWKGCSNGACLECPKEKVGKCFVIMVVRSKSGRGGCSIRGS